MVQMQNHFASFGVVLSHHEGNLAKDRYQEIKRGVGFGKGHRALFGAWLVAGSIPAGEGALDSALRGCPWQPTRLSLPILSSLPQPPPGRNGKGRYFSRRSAGRPRDRQGFRPKTCPGPLPSTDIAPYISALHDACLVSAALWLPWLRSSHGNQRVVAKGRPGGHVYRGPERITCVGEEATASVGVAIVRSR